MPSDDGIYQFKGKLLTLYNFSQQSEGSSPGQPWRATRVLADARRGSAARKARENFILKESVGWEEGQCAGQRGDASGELVHNFWMLLYGSLTPYTSTDAEESLLILASLCEEPSLCQSRTSVIRRG